MCSNTSELDHWVDLEFCSSLFLCSEKLSVTVQAIAWGKCGDDDWALGKRLLRK